MIDLAPEHLGTVRDILAAHLPGIEVRVFGSRFTGKAKRYSDLDLAVVAPAALDSDRLRLLKEAFEESDLPFRVDVVDWHVLSTGFQQVIASAHEVIQEAAPAD